MRKTLLKKINHEESAITLLVLVITIVILLILAGITISAVTGDNGIIRNAGQAKEETEIVNEKEIVEKATVQAMGNNKYGNIEEEELQKQLDKETAEGKTKVSIIRKKYIVEFIDSQRMYRIDDSGNVYEYIYTDLPIMESGLDFCNRMKEYRTQIINIKVVNYVEVPEKAVKSFDVSKTKDESVMAWFVVNEENNEYYDLYIGGNDGVQASENCQNMFSDMENVISIDLEEFYTDNTTNFGYMFQSCKNLEKINLSNLNTSKASYMGSLFASCSKLKELDISHFDTSKVTDMSAMFYGCKSLKMIDFTNIDTSNVRYMNAMFRQCELESLDLSTFDTSNVIRTDLMFYSCYNLKTIYVSDKWSNNKVTASNDMFKNCSNLRGSINYDSTKVDIEYANYENGYFTYKE